MLKVEAESVVSMMTMMSMAVSISRKQSTSVKVAETKMPLKSRAMILEMKVVLK